MSTCSSSLPDSIASTAVSTFAKLAGAWRVLAALFHRDSALSGVTSIARGLFTAKASALLVITTHSNSSATANLAALPIIDSLLSDKANSCRIESIS